MKATVNAVAASIGNEAWATGIPITKHDPVFSDLDKGPQLYIYGTRRVPGPDEFRTTGSREDIFEIVVEYIEPGRSKGQEFKRDATREEAVLDIADAVVGWADDNQTFPAAGVWRFDFSSVDYPPDVRRNLLVRHFIARFTAYKRASYG